MIRLVSRLMQKYKTSDDRQCSGTLLWGWGRCPSRGWGVLQGGGVSYKRVGYPSRGWVVLQGGGVGVLQGGGVGVVLQGSLLIINEQDGDRRNLCVICGLV